MYMYIYSSMLIYTYIYMHRYTSCVYNCIYIQNLGLYPSRPLTSLSLELLVLQLGLVPVLVLLEVLEVQQELQGLEQLQELAAGLLFDLSRWQGCCSRRPARSPQRAARRGVAGIWRGPCFTMFCRELEGQSCLGVHLAIQVVHMRLRSSRLQGASESKNLELLVVTL